MKFVIEGGKKLTGEIVVAGAKNSISKVMVATLLTPDECVIENVPDIGEVEIVTELCEAVGSKVTRGEGTLTIVTPEIKSSTVLSLSRRNRIPILALGPLLIRAGEAEVPFLGGDKIGARPVNFHLNALEQMGAKIETREGSYRATAPNGLKGARITLAFPSVGATENIILAAVLAKGRTVIQNAAVEPEIVDLIKMLQNMGAIIERGANRMISIEGVAKLHGVRHKIIPDRIEAASFACLALATEGPVFVKNARQHDLITFLNAVRRIGGEYEAREDGITFYKPKGLKHFKGVEIETDTHPGFMTDWQQPFAVLLTQAQGLSIVHETIWEDRFAYTDQLNQMGADIKVLTKCMGEVACRFSGQNFAHSAVINGPTPLKAIDVTVKDLRSGMVNIIAALIAKGTSTISGVEEVDRGYEKLDARLKALGANITRVA